MTDPQTIASKLVGDESSDGPVQLRMVGKNHFGQRRWDAFDTHIGDWVGVVPPFPTTQKERVEATVAHLNAHYRTHLEKESKK